MNTLDASGSLFNYWLADHLDVRLFAADTVTIGAQWCCPPGKSRFWRLYYHDHSGAALRFADRELALRGQRIYVVPAGQTFVAHCAAPVQQFFVEFGVTGLPDMALRTLFRQPICLPPNAALTRNVRQFARELLGAPEGEADQDVANSNWNLDVRARQSINVALQWRIKALVYQALAAYVESATPQEMAQCWQFADEVRSLVPALRCIEENLGAALNNTFLAQMCGFSEDHFIRAFGAALGETPAHYIRERRVDEAARRLLASASSIDDIARDLGFCDRAHFSRVFKQSTGTSPALYRSQRS